MCSARCMELRINKRLQDSGGYRQVKGKYKIDREHPTQSSRIEKVCKEVMTFTMRAKGKRESSQVW